MTPLAFTQLGFNITITPLVLFVIMALLVLSWALFTVVIRYHWKSYGTGKAEVFSMNFFYLIGSVVLMIFMGIFALYYFSSTL